MTPSPESIAKITRSLFSVQGPGKTAEAVTATVLKYLEVCRQLGQPRPGLKDLSTFIDSCLEAIHRGQGDMASAVYAMVVALLHGGRIVSESPLQMLRDLSQIIMTATAKINGDVREAALGLIEGVVDQAKHLKLKTSEAVCETATAAVAAARQIDEVTGARVRDSLTGTISGINIKIINTPPAQMAAI